MLDPAYPSYRVSHDREIGPTGDAPTSVSTDDKIIVGSAPEPVTFRPTGQLTGKLISPAHEHQAQRDARRLSSLRRTIKRWDTRAKAKGYDTIIEALDAAPIKSPSK